MTALLFSPQQPIYRNMKRVGQSTQFKIGNRPLLSLQKRECGNTDLNAGSLQLCQQINLLHSNAQTGFRHSFTNHVSVSQRQFSSFHSAPPFLPVYEKKGGRIMAMLSKSCAFSGHRPQKFPWKYHETDSRCVALKMVLMDQIRLLVNAGVTQFLSGMAEATDTWSALFVLALREKNPALKLHCILPCTTQTDSLITGALPLHSGAG